MTPPTIEQTIAKLGLETTARAIAFLSLITRRSLAFPSPRGTPHLEGALPQSDVLESARLALACNCA